MRGEIGDCAKTTLMMIALPMLHAGGQNGHTSQKVCIMSSPHEASEGVKIRG